MGGAVAHLAPPPLGYASGTVKSYLSPLREYTRPASDEIS